MIASLRDVDIDLLCHGVGSWGDVRSGGLVSCDVALCPNSFDVAMARMERTKSMFEGRARKYQNKPLEAGFVVTRDDGVAFYIHPKHGDNKVACWLVNTQPSPAPIPASGIYGTDGPGTFKRIQTWDKLTPLRFDMAAVAAARAQ